MGAHTKRHLLELLDPQMRPVVEQRVIDIVGASFTTDRERAINATVKPGPPTRNEIKRRVNIVYNWIGVMRNQIGYSIHRTLDLLPHALRATLDGVAWEPPPLNRAWTSKG